MNKKAMARRANDKASRSKWTPEDAFIYEQYMVKEREAKRQEIRYLATDKDGMTPERHKEVIKIIRSCQRVRYMAQCVLDELERKYPLPQWRPKTKR